MYSQLTLADIGSSILELEEFHANYQSFFHTSDTYDTQQWSKAYLHSTFVCDKRRNIANRARSVPGGNVQNMHHFISNAPWLDQPIVNQLQKDTYRLIGSQKEGALIIDESGIPKKGYHSVGVARQYCGALGKTDHCQVGVYLAYSSLTQTTLIDRRLYLPKEWFASDQRRKESGVPKTSEFQTKGQLALSMILQSLTNGIRFDFVSGDATYGDCPWLRDALGQRGLLYFMEISSDTLIWRDRPQTIAPCRKRKRGRPPTKPKLAPGSPPPISVQALAATLPSERWEKVVVREGEKHPLEWEFCALRVVTRRDELPGPEEWLILRRSLTDKSDYKYALSNAPPCTLIETHAQRMARRYWVERAIQIGKSGAGLDEYELRHYTGWHHHQTMTLLAMLFLLQLRIKLADKAPMLTIEDVREILQVILPKEEFSPADVLKFIEDRHRARAAAKTSHYLRYNAEKQTESARDRPQQ
jgi:SRSO17 transposase